MLIVIYRSEIYRIAWLRELDPNSSSTNPHCVDQASTRSHVHILLKSSVSGEHTCQRWPSVSFCTSHIPYSISY